MDQALTFLHEHPTVEALAILATSLLAGVLVETITARVLLKLTEKTSTDVDDAIVAAVRRPLFLSVVLAGAWLALIRLDVSDGGRYVARAVLITLAVLLWSAAAMRVSKFLLGRLAERVEDFRFVQPRTVPLFEIILKMVILGGAAYGILLAWVYH